MQKANQLSDNFIIENWIRDQKTNAKMVGNVLNPLKINVPTMRNIPIAQEISDMSERGGGGPGNWY